MDLRYYDLPVVNIFRIQIRLSAHAISEIRVVLLKGNFIKGLDIKEDCLKP